MAKYFNLVVAERTQLAKTLEETPDWPQYQQQLENTYRTYLCTILDAAREADRNHHCSRTEIDESRVIVFVETRDANFWAYQLEVPKKATTSLNTLCNSHFVTDDEFTSITRIDCVAETLQLDGPMAPNASFNGTKPRM